MRTIDLNKIIEKRGLDPNDVAQQLFPKNKYPKLATKNIKTKN